MASESLPSRARYWAIVAGAAERLAQPLSVQHIVDAILSSARDLLGAEAMVGIWCMDHARRKLLLLASRGLSEALLAQLGELPIDAPFLAARSVATRRPQIVRDAAQLGREQQAVRELMERESLSTVVAIPLVQAGEPIGTIAYALHRNRPLAHEELRSLGVLAQLFGNALGNAFAHENTRRRADYMASLASETEKRLEAERRRVHETGILLEAARLVSASLDLRDSMTGLSGLLARLFGTARGVIFVQDGPGSGVLRLYGSFGIPRHTLRLLESNPLDLGQEALTRRLYETLRPVVLEQIDYEALGPVERAAADYYGLKSLLSVPLVSKGRPLGVIFIGFVGRARHFEEREVAILEAIAGQVGVAIENCRLYMEVQRRIEELERERSQRETLMSIIAHDLKGALTPIIGYAQLLAGSRALPEDRQVRMLAVLVDQARRLNRLVGDLLDFSRIAAGQMVLERGTVNLTQLARQVVEGVQLQAEGHRIRLQADEKVEGCWDADRLAQVLTNLVSNAIRYSPVGGEIDVRLRRERGWAEVCVHDRGVGIAQEDLPCLFQPFARLSGGDRTGGLGLGLYIARGIVEAHGGTIWAESAGLGRGSSFCFQLPLGSASPRA